MNVFELNDISFSYLQGNVVFEKVTMTIPKGRFLAMVGPNGAGKSTLLKICVGLLKPNSGVVKVFDTPISQYKDWSKVVYIAQQTLRDRNFPVTVEEVVAMGRVASVGIGSKLKNADHEIVEEAISTVGLQDLRRRMIGELSGGQQQRVAIAKALAARPEALLLDEATSGVDTETREAIYSLLRNINRVSGTSIIMVSHDVERIVRYADDIASIDGGVSYYGTASAFQCQCELKTANITGNVEWGKRNHA